MAECEITIDEPRSIASPLARVVESILSAPSTDLEAYERERAAREKFGAWCEFIRGRGERYEDCWLKNFEQVNDKQRDAVALLTDYCRDVDRRINGGDGLLLFGPKGTGKDHLIVSVARAAIRAGKRVKWQNGMDFFGDIRDAIDNGSEERAMVARLVAPDVLYISDPLPPFGQLTDFQSTMLFRVLDGRYSRRKPTWCSVNVSSGSELDTRMGAQNGDRLRDGAVAIFCDWPSYRKVKS